MTSINPNLIPNKPPGTLFTALSGDDQTLNVRYHVANEPVYYEVFNRPLKDLNVRQLVIAKALDTFQIAISSSLYYPFLIAPRINCGSDEVEIPIGWIWDMRISIPEEWDTVRLAKVKRISGTGPSGILRLIFTASRVGSTVEVSVLFADYEIESELSYQLVRLRSVTSDEESVVLSAEDVDRFSGSITFQTLDLSRQDTEDFYNCLAPNTNSTTNNSGIYDTPAVYETSDSISGSAGVTGDFANTQISHGTAILTNSAISSIPSQTVNGQGLLDSLNYPFSTNANLTSIDNIKIPQGMFSEFDILVPAGELPTGDSSGTFSPIWINKIERLENSSLRLYFATHNVTDSSPIPEGVEFAILDLNQSNIVDTILPIVSINNLQNVPLDRDNQNLYNQQFGRGHVRLSSLWDNTNPIILNFFSAMMSLGTVTLTVFPIANTRLGPMALSRSSKYIPTIGENQAMAGSTGIGLRGTPIPPSNTNRYVTQADEGFGEQIDLETINGITPNVAIRRYGNSGTITHKAILLCIDQTQIDESDSNFYDDHVLPRLEILLGRKPVFMDIWYDGSRFLLFNGDTWQSP